MVVYRDGVGAVIRSSFIGMSIFFGGVCLCYETPLYSGDREEYWAGVPKSLYSFLASQRFIDAYGVFSFFFAPLFFTLAMCLNWGAPDSGVFITTVMKEAAGHVAGRKRPNHEILVPGWLITSHVA